MLDVLALCGVRVCLHSSMPMENGNERDSGREREKARNMQIKLNEIGSECSKFFKA